MNNSVFDIIREKAVEISKNISAPFFYIDNKREIECAERRALVSEDVKFSRDIIIAKGGVWGHGYRHANSVAIEAGAIVYCELGMSDKSDTIADNALISGYLHDIKRDEKNHPEMAALEVESLYKNRISGKNLDMIIFAIRNHEAFKDRDVIDDDEFMLCADSLYDADKFRWGPDNFTDTLWNMAESMNMSLNVIMKNYERGIESIIRIKDSFRTITGKKYGPGFIDAGLEIGEEIYKFWKKGLNG